MIRYIDHAKMGRGQHGWLDSHFHFSFAEYCNPENINFGVLRVMNDDLVQIGTGFDTHPHENMEIISYVVQGELTHKDSMRNEYTLTRGQVQYMSAGTGVFHSEYNLGKDLLRFFQIWIFPDKKGYTPDYGDFRFKLEDRYGKWLPIATCVKNKDSAAPIKIHQDINAYAAILDSGKSLDFEVAADRQAYLVVIEGGAVLQGRAGGTATLAMRDAAEITAESFTLTAETGAAVKDGEVGLLAEGVHVLVIEMQKE